MPNTNHRKKTQRQAEVRAIRNRSERAAMRTAVKKALTAAETDGKAAEAPISDAASLVDKAAKHGLLHPNKAARMKSRMMRIRNRTAAK